jgi:glycerophosphoryl diester phosphodiesterase
MASMQGAVQVGSHALETDIHLTKDGVVVLSHVRLSASQVADHKKLTTNPGPDAQTLLRQTGQDHRLQMGVFEHTAYNGRPARTDASTPRPARIHGTTWP